MRPDTRTKQPIDFDGVVPLGSKSSTKRRVNLNLITGSILVGLVLLMALTSFVWLPYQPSAIDPSNLLSRPTPTHWLGTDSFGRDIFSQILAGARTTLLVGIVSVAISGTLGVAIGMLAAASAGWVSDPVMRFMDVIIAFPAVLLAIILAAGFGASTLTAMVAIGVATIPTFARLARASSLQILQSGYILAARSYGRHGVVLLVKYVLPNIMAVVIVQASVSFAIAILAEAALSYLGFATPPPTPSWGRMLQEAQNYLAVEPLLAVWPGLAIAFAVLGFNLLGDGLRDVLDPRLRGR